MQISSAEMFSKTPNPVHSHTRSPVSSVLKILTFSKWIGCLPIQVTYTDTGSVRLRFARFHCATVIWLVTLAGHCFFLTHQTIALSHSQRSSINLLVDALLALSVNLPSMIVPRLSLFYVQYLEAALNHMLEFHTLLRPKTSYRKRWLWLGLLVAEIFLFLPNMVRLIWVPDVPPHKVERLMFGSGGIRIEDITLDRVMKGIHMTYFVLTSWVMPLQLLAICQTLAEYFTSFDEEIRNSLTGNQYPSNENTVSNNDDPLQKLHTASLKLESATRAVDTYFGLPLLLYMACRLGGLLGRLYGFREALYQKTSNTSFGTFKSATKLVVTTQNVFYLLLPIWAADSLVGSAKRCTQSVREMPMPKGNLTMRSRLVLDESRVEWLRNHIKDWKVEITAFGFFEMSRNLVTSILGAVVTYFIIIVQFSNEDRSEHACRNVSNTA